MEVIGIVAHAACESVWQSPHSMLLKASHGKLSKKIQFFLEKRIFLRIQSE